MNINLPLPTIDLPQYDYHHSTTANIAADGERTAATIYNLHLHSEYLPFAVEHPPLLCTLHASLGSSQHRHLPAPAPPAQMAFVQYGEKLTY